MAHTAARMGQWERTSNWGWTHFWVPLRALVGMRTEQGLQEVKLKIPFLPSSPDRDGAGPPAGPNSPRGHTWGMANQWWDLSTAPPSTQPSVVLLAHRWVTHERKDSSERMNQLESPNQHCCLAWPQTLPHAKCWTCRGDICGSGWPDVPGKEATSSEAIITQLPQATAQPEPHHSQPRG